MSVHHSCPKKRSDTGLSPIILARKDEPTPDYARAGDLRDEDPNSTRCRSQVPDSEWKMTSPVPRTVIRRSGRKTQLSVPAAARVLHPRVAAHWSDSWAYHAGWSASRGGRSQGTMESHIAGKLSLRRDRGSSGRNGLHRSIRCSGSASCSVFRMVWEMVSETHVVEGIQAPAISETACAWISSTVIGRARPVASTER